jgi:hypothetical protein
VASAQDEIAAAGATVVAVAPAAHRQAVALEPKLQILLYLDPAQQISNIFELVRPTLFEWITNLPAWARYVRALLRNRRQYRITGHFSNVPAVAILDRFGAIEYIHRGRAIGDYPPIAEVLARLRGNR